MLARVRDKISHSLLEECKMLQLLWKTAGPLLTKLNIALPYDQQLVLGGVYPNESKSQFYMRIYT